MIKKSLHVITILIYILLLFNCSKQQENIVIDMNQVKIDEDEFLKSFNTFPRYKKGMTLKEAVQKQADYLIENAYFTLAAYKVQLNKDPEVQKRLQGLVRKEVLLKLYDDKIKSKINISDEEKKEAFKRMNIKLVVRHLLFKTREDAQRAREKLIAGEESFESLAQKIFRDPVLRRNGGLLGAITFGDTDPDFENAAYNLKKGEISEPVRTKYGYHLIKVEEVQYQVFRTEDQYIKSLPYIESELRKRKSDSLVSDFFKSEFPDLKINIHSRGVKVLTDILKDTFSKFKIDSTLKKRPPLILPEIEMMEKRLRENEILVDFNGTKWTVKDFIERLKYTLPYDRPDLRNPTRLVSSIASVVRDEILYQYALKQGYLEDNQVKKNIAARQNELLADEFRKRYMFSSFKKMNPDVWNNYFSALKEIKNEIKPIIKYELIYNRLGNPDSVISEHPVPVVLQERY